MDESQPFRAPSAHQAPALHAIMQRAQRLAEKGDSAGARDQLVRAVRAAPDVAEYHAYLSQTEFSLGHLAEAESAARKAVALRQDDPEFRAWLARVLRRSGHKIQALASYRAALKLHPGHWAGSELPDVRAEIAASVQHWHLPMLADTPRNDAFDGALRALVRPDDIVLDIGTGTGLLAMMAARAGASHVYACEMDPALAELAVEIIARNGLTDRITVIAKKSTDLVVGVDMPTTASLLVTETFDSLLIGEGALATIADARARLLRQDARVIPSGGRIMGQLASAPMLRQVHPLRNIAGFDLSALTELGLPKKFHPLMPGLEQWTALSAPGELVRIGFDGDVPSAGNWSAELPVTQAGTAQALVLWLELEMGDGAVLSAAPGGPVRHWNPVVYLMDADCWVGAGDGVRVTTRINALSLEFNVA